MFRLLSIDHKVKSRLEQLDLTKDKLSEVAKRAIAQKFNAVSNHPVNAPGTFAYHEGVRALREIFADGDKWNKLVERGIEYIENPDKKIRVIYQNVDHACIESNDPQPISKRGGTAKRNAISSNQLELFEREIPISNVFVLCVSENNGIVNAELSLPTDISEDGYLSKFIERIFILQDYDYENHNKSDDNSDKDEYDDEFRISLKT